MAEVPEVVPPAEITGPENVQNIVLSDDNDVSMQDTSMEAAGASNHDDSGSMTKALNGPKEDMMNLETSHGNKDTARDASNIRDDLAAVLEGDVDFKGAFSFHRTYPDAPNPGFQLSDLGTVGLPLGPREAEAVKSRCAQAPFGKGERTLIDKTVRDTWEMDASQVKCGNPRWSQFLSRVVREVCEALGVNFMASLPRCELYKLLLYETGSHFLPHVDTEKQDGMFATIVVVLPSAFTGGEAHLSHGGLSTVYDCSPNSHYDTTVLAWYTDVTHEIKPITSGYRLALSFNLIHTTQSLRPALSANADLVVRLRGILTAWKKDRGLHSPEKLVYLLDHTYSQANLSASALKGVDAHKVAMLDTIAKELGFRLGLASIECHQVGPADAGYGDEYYGFADIHDTSMSVTCFKDLEGQLIRSTLDFKDEVETIPWDLRASIEEGDADEEEYEGYQGNYGGDLERWYRRTVLVIWPSWSNYSVQYTGEKGLWHALADIKNITSPHGTSDETELIDFVISRFSQDPGTVARAVTEIALIWHDAELWNRTVKTCCATEGLKTISEERIQLAIKHFGLETVKSGIEEMLDKDTRNAARIEFLDRFREWINELPDDTPDKAALQEWSTASATRVLATLRKPQKSEQPLLLSVAMNNGGIEYVKDHMLHQLISIADSSFLREFATTVHEFPVFPDCDAKSTVVSSLLAAAISRACFFKPAASVQAPHYGYPYYNAKPPAPQPDFLTLAKVYIIAARDLGQSHLANAVIDRIMDVSKFNAAQAQECARKVIVPLVKFLGQASSLPLDGDRLQLPTRFPQLQQEGIRLYLDWLSNSPSGLTQEQFEILVDAALAGGNSDVFVKTVWPRLESSKLNGAGLQLLIKQLVANRDKLISAGVDGPSVQSMIDTLAKRTISSISLQTISEIVSALDWCMKMNAPDLCNTIVKRFFSSGASSTPYLEQVLTPGLPQLRTWGIKHKRDMNPVVQKIVTAWTEKVLGALPAANSSLANQLAALVKWTCSCASCSSAHTFLTASDQKSTTLYRIGAPARKHVEGHLSIHARSLATWTLHRTTPQGLILNKSDALCKLIRWRANQAKGVALLKTLSADENELRIILGPEYDRVKAVLSGRAVGQTSGPATQPHPPTATSGLRAGPSTNPTVGSAQQRVASGSAMSVPQQETASSSATSGPPVKKRKHTAYNPDDVIDLT